ncbi:protein-tyrosine phosphatase family protein [Shinella sp. G-2]|uniref:protein-tyrosine phosphatase family protein n=1 Tax=Shinella sp. G-2 TaxID=3133141 RepID=UPI003D01E3CC
MADIEETISIRATVDCPGGGRLVTLGAPGVTIDHRGEAWIDPDGIDETLQALVAGGAALFLFLARDGDCPPGFRPMLRQRVRQAGIVFAALPIDDFSAPGAAWMRAWRRLEGRISALLAGGRAIALCCSYGAGRSGMVAAHILNGQGLPVEEALSAVRQAFPESVESPLQEAWLHLQDKGCAQARRSNGKGKA